MFYSLLRTIPTLSGNVKIACNLSDYIKSTVKENDKNVDYFDCYCRYARLLPLSSNLYQKNIKANLLGSSYDYDLKSFYTYYKDIFYNNNFEYDKNNLEKIDKTSPQYQRNTDLEFGVKRVSYVKNDAQFAFFAPIYITSVDDIPLSFIISCTFSNNLYSTTKKIRVNLKSDIKNNYLYKYLEKYISKIDDNVIFMKPESKQATYYGIDVKNGGLVKGYDNIISELFQTQHTINAFDATINNGFKRNYMVMKQILPLCFLFNPINLLTSYEQKRYANCNIQFSGHYINKTGNIQPFSDFYIDYDEFAQDITIFNSNTGNMTLSDGNVSNIMDCSFPSLLEKRVGRYQFSSKLSPMFNRWKLKYSSDSYPYITNISWAFSKNQDSNYSYREFISKYSQIPMVGNIIKVDGSNKYNTMLPIGDMSISVYDDYNFNIKNSYKNIMNLYGCNWFDISTMDSDTWIDGIEWADISDNYCYYKGVLYDMSQIYNYLQTGYEEIDKFAIILKPNFKVIDNEAMKSINVANFTLLRDREYVNNANCNTNTNLVYSALDDRTNYNWLYSNELNLYANAHELKVNKMFKYVSTDEELSSYRCIYTKLSYIGVDYSEVNKYYSYSSVYKGLAYVTDDYISSYILNKYPTYTKTEVNNAIDTLRTMVSDVTYLYNIDKYTTGHKMLPITLASMVTDYDETSDTYNIILDDSCSYNSVTYVLYNCDVTSYNGVDIPVIPNKPGSNENAFDFSRIVYKDGNPQYCTPGFGNPNQIFSLTNTITSDGYIQSYIPAYQTNGNLVAQWWFDPILSYIAVSSSDDLSKVSNVYKEYANSYIYVDNKQETLQISYNFSLYVRNKFYKASNISKIAYLDYTDILYTGVKTNYPTTSSYILSYIAPIKEYFTSSLVSYLDNQDKYEYNPVGFNGNDKYATSFFTKKTSGSENFYGNDILSYNIKKDRDVIWLDIYNMCNVCQKYDIDFDSMLTDGNIWKDAYILFLNKKHVYYWYYTIHKDQHQEDYDEESYDDWNNIGWTNHVFIRYRKLVNIDGANGIELKDKIIPLQTFLKENIGQELNFYNFYNKLTYLESDDIFYIKKDDNNKVYFELLFTTTLVRLNDSIYENIINIDKENSKYKDLYLYVIQTVDEYEQKISRLNYYDKINYETYNKYINNVNSSIIYKDIDNVLQPLFYNVFMQDKIDESLWVQYQLHDISEVNISDETKNYRCGRNSVNYMIQLSDEEISKWEESTGEKMKRYYLFDQTSLRLSLDYNDLKYYSNDNIPSNPLNTIKKDGVNYGFYIINYDFDNTSNTFEIYVNEYNDGQLVRVHNNVNQIEYYKEHNIIDNPSFFVNDIRLLLPFMRHAMTDVISSISPLVKPHTFNISNIYVNQLIDNTNNSNEVAIIKKYDTNVKQVYLRYMNFIMPAFHNVVTITNQYNLKFKDTNNTILDTGKFNSIGDSPIYASDISINKYHPIQVYTHDNNLLMKDYNNMSFTFTPVEYKHYNVSKGINLSPTLEYETTRNYTYNELIEMETDEMTINTFIKLITKSTSIKYTDDEILFLYKKYKHSYSSVCIGLNTSLDEKMYSLKYIFELY